MTEPTDDQFRRAAAKMISTGSIQLMAGIEPDDHGEVQRPHGQFAYVSVWLRVPAELASEEEA